MKTVHTLTTLIVAIAGFAATAAIAQEASYEYPQATTSTLTRAQVLADLAQARRDGSMRVYSASYNHMAAAKSVKSRAEVQAEMLAAERVTAAALTSEDSGSFALSRVPVRDASTPVAAR